MNTTLSYKIVCKKTLLVCPLKKHWLNYQVKNAYAKKTDWSDVKNTLEEINEVILK